MKLSVPKLPKPQEGYHPSGASTYAQTGPGAKKNQRDLAGALAEGVKVAMGDDVKAPFKIRVESSTKRHK